MRPARILLLVIAIVAGGLAAFFATRGEPPAEPVILAETNTGQVLVAARSIGMGERLSPDVVEWQDWPDEAIRPEYLTRDRLPDAPAQMAGTVARFEIFVGEPIRESKLVHTDQGYLSAVITPGMRAVSVAVTAESGAGGFIVPNDRVDVVLTRRVDGIEVSQTILNSVRVLAIGHRLGELGVTGEAETNEPESQTFDRATVATLELNPVQSETILNANLMGNLSLVLRSIVDFDQETTGGASREGASSVKLIRFGRETSVTSTGDEEPSSNSDAPVVEPISFETDSFDSTAPELQPEPATAPVLE